MLYGPYIWAKARKEDLSSYGLALRPSRKALAEAAAVSIATLVPLTFTVVAGWPGQSWPRTVSWTSAWAFAASGFVAAVSEEVFFRGLVQTLLGRVLPPVLAIGGASALFALSHLLFRSDLFYLLTFFPGLVMGWLRWRHKDITGAILYHALGNFWAIWFFPRP